MFGADGAIVVSVAAQVAPLCCGYLVNWDEEVGRQGACSGDTAAFCETSSQNCQGQSNACQQKRHSTRPAECCIVTLGEGEYFIRANCDQPPEEDAILIGPLPDGTCCWVGGTVPNPHIECYEQEFHVQRCVALCEGDEVPP